MNKNYIKLTLDIILVLIFSLLFNVRVFGGLAFHEIAGLGIGFGFLIHILLNSQWVKKITLRLFDSKLPKKIRFGYFLNLLLLIAMLLSIVSGLLISKVLFPGLGSVDPRSFRQVHEIASYLALVIVGIHVGLHGQWILNLLKKIFRVGASKPIIVVVKLALAIVVLFGGLDVLSNQITPQTLNPGNPPSVNSERVPNSNSSNQIERRPDHLEGSMKGSVDGGRRGEFRNANPSGVLATFLGVIGLLAVVTYITEKLFAQKPLKIQED
ncbi:DUF4405 domain-containing protein [Desulfitobacterium sp. Sab5]|uniref:DUF4405 domain-containing protein n=1 Tax=Desulfitobacterium nosdiversum TaxID=3375356 RepID=UPI003CFA791F